MPRRTYTAWLKKQEFRQDETGWLARYWAEVTPGRINSAEGVRRTLETIEPDPGTPADRALAAMAAAVTEFEGGGDAPLAAVPEPLADFGDDFPAEAALAKVRADVADALGPARLAVQRAADAGAAARDAATLRGIAERLDAIEAGLSLILAALVRGNGDSPACAALADDWPGEWPRGGEQPEDWAAAFAAAEREA